MRGDSDPFIGDLSEVAPQPCGSHSGACGTAATGASSLRSGLECWWLRKAPPNLGEKQHWFWCPTMYYVIKLENRSENMRKTHETWNEIEIVLCSVLLFLRFYEGVSTLSLWKWQHLQCPPFHLEFLERNCLQAASAPGFPENQSCQSSRALNLELAGRDLIHMNSWRQVSMIGTGFQWADGKYILYNPIHLRDTVSFYKRKNI